MNVYVCGTCTVYTTLGPRTILYVSSGMLGIVWGAPPLFIVGATEPSHTFVRSQHAAQSRSFCSGSDYHQEDVIAAHGPNFQLTDKQLAQLYFKKQLSKCAIKLLQHIINQTNTSITIERSRGRAVYRHAIHIKYTYNNKPFKHIMHITHICLSYMDRCEK